MKALDLECYVIYDRRREEFYNYKTGSFGTFADASLFDDPDISDLIPDGEEWCVVMKVAGTATMVTP